MKTNKLTSFLNKTKFKIKKHSPEILLGAGIIGGVASTVLACRATIKAQEIFNEAEENEKVIENVKETMPEKYSEEDYNNDMKIVKVQTNVKLAKAYLPAIGVGMISIALLLKSHKIMKKRNLAIAAAYATLDKGFKNYRKNVCERYGTDVDKELLYGIKAKAINEKTTDENGNEIEETKLAYDITDPNMISEYARIFDRSSRSCTKNHEYNLLFLKKQQKYANDILKCRTYLFLNDVYDLLDIPRTQAGQTVGWVYDPNNDIGDNYIDFGIYDLKKDSNRRYINGYEDSILLDFNVDGVILDKIEKQEKELRNKRKSWQTELRELTTGAVLKD